ncbi:MAG: HIT family protein [Anaerocolumna sp.]
MSDNCIFCSIIGKEISSTTIYEDEWVKAIMDISPANKGHVIIISKKHCENIFDLDEEATEKIFITVKKIAVILKEELQCDGINILQNNGKAAGQTVFHFHIHIIPRYEEDNVTIDWEYESYKEGELKALGEKLIEKMNRQ